METNPSTGYQKLRTVWRETLADPDFDAYVRSKIPDSVKDMPGFEPDKPFDLEPNMVSPPLYDAVTALGLSMCSAGSDAEFFTGPEIYEYFRNLDFAGTSGRVLITPETGTRNYTTVPFVMWNVQDYPKKDSEGRVQFQIAPASSYNGKWNSVEGMTFMYNGGSTETPESLPPVTMDMNYIGKTGQIIGYILMGIVMLCAIISFVWLVYYRNHEVIFSSQPVFLLMVSIGSFVMASTIIPLSLEEPVSAAGLDIACMSSPWIYIMGGVITLSALFAKTRAIHMVSCSSGVGSYMQCSIRDCSLSRLP